MEEKPTIVIQQTPSGFKVLNNDTELVIDYIAFSVIIENMTSTPV